VIAAHRLGDIDDPRKMLLDLRAAGMWISDAVIDQALRLAGLN
jgi:predicted nucleic acid-binding protein